MTDTWISSYDLMNITLPEGKVGSAEIRKFEITEEEARMASMFGRGGRGYTPPGEYTKLVVNGQLWMSDTADERRDHTGFVGSVRRDQGSQPLAILITGLGIGMVLNAMLQTPRVALVDVVEINQDVIDLVGPHYQKMADEHGVRLNIHHGDAYDRAGVFGKGQRRWDYAWHDIWQNICGDEYEGMKKIRRQYGRYVGEQDCWCADQTKRLYFENKRAVESRRARYAAMGWNR